MQPTLSSTASQDNCDHKGEPTTGRRWIRFDRASVSWIHATSFLHRGQFRLVIPKSLSADNISPRPGRSISHFDLPSMRSGDRLTAFQSIVL
jgi:hypothetical protein